MTPKPKKLPAVARLDEQRVRKLTKIKQHRQVAAWQRKAGEKRKRSDG